jgi:hypothetical protein
VANRRRPLSGGANGDVTDLPIGGHIAEHHEVAQRVAHRLLMQRSLEDP